MTHVTITAADSKPYHLLPRSSDSSRSGSFAYGDLKAMFSRYDPAKLQHGHTVDGEELFFIANPGLGLWAYGGRF